MFIHQRVEGDRCSTDDAHIHGNRHIQPASYGVTGSSGAKRLGKRLALLALCGLGMLLGIAACGGEDSDSGGSGHVQMAQTCAPDYPGLPNDCSSGLCEYAAWGEVCSQSCGSCGAPSTICTQRCNQDSDCGGMSYVAANAQKTCSDTLEDWVCYEGICQVWLTDVSDPVGGICDHCGGAICGGDCIGCPQCR